MPTSATKAWAKALTAANGSQIEALRSIKGTPLWDALAAEADKQIARIKRNQPKKAA